jgi:Spy/CpxP family protein refolding chaperone
MKGKSVKTLLALTMLSLIVISYQAKAQGPQNDQKGQGKEVRHRAMKKVVEDLGLTEEQQEQMKEHRDQNHQKMRETHEKMRQARQALKTELEKEKSNNKAINEISTSLKTMQADMVDNRIKSILELKEVLTYEQFKQFGEKTRKLHEKGKEFRQKNKRSSNQGEKPWAE